MAVWLLQGQIIKKINPILLIVYLFHKPVVHVLPNNENIGGKTVEKSFYTFVITKAEMKHNSVPQCH